ncbi:hypothetical protein EJ05DRAFT_466054 [Pseudovirgaria hyperparasitica]|uniref:SacI domain-containing protein n=1 Tax=Pseudovirgaria hyperparasitica TaxID=470096 RepID=A0A6A6W5I9_9PEZI|nr:uncharacterized protein EJ05DRAFT_466054 [Pseudovirgaria hyperparasitica]KAF2756827.1 hypothetical protein EJ05DRAFT_466054 [Pseudovirgaria hyperparasitica]
MPSIVRKLLIFAAVDGLILQPAPPKNHPPTTHQAIKIDWKGNVGPLLNDRREEPTAENVLESWGIVGLFKVASTSFLVSIASREQVAHIRRKPIYVISDVSLIPLVSQAEAEKAITSAKDHLRRQTSTETALGPEDDDSSAEESDTATVTDDESLPESVPSTPRTSLEKDAATVQERQRRTSIGQDVIARRGLYGRFADQWFSRKGWSTQQRKRQGISSDDSLAQRRQQDLEQTMDDDNLDSSKPTNYGEGNKQTLDGGRKLNSDEVRPAVCMSDVPVEEIPKALGDAENASSITLLPKILRTTKIYFGSKSFYFSYDIDLSRRLAIQSLTPSSQPLFKQFDPLYLWNHHMASPFIDAGQLSFVLPIIQGFVGQRAFTVNTSMDSHLDTVVDAATSLQAILSKHDEVAKKQAASATESETKDFLLTLISRRSTLRAGLRYLRRGVDGEGNVANSVETEQLLSSPTWDTTNNAIYSFTQCRGSIPLIFSQSPYSLKPAVTLQGSEEMNASAFRLHFANLASRYGTVYADSLVDKHGTEAKVGKLYEQHAEALNKSGGIDGKGSELGFEWFDFHNVCRGMRFENVSILMDTLGPFLHSTGFTVQEGDTLTSIQSGILRTNCMDCLDRTNVVQSATGRAALETQLSYLNIKIDLQTDPRTSWFNTLWADNGDAVSKQYSGTAALKGDYTRTRKRQISGALTDFGLTLTRYYNNIVNDYFAQALIDYLLGRAPESIFAEFEADMKTTDYALDMRKVRQSAIHRAAEIVIEDPGAEDLIHGWTLSCPAESNTLRTLPFEECVLLLTEKAAYMCRLDWQTEKVKMFERVDLGDMISLSRGTYITSTLAPRHLDTSKNVGLVLQFRTGSGKDLVRRNTRSLDSSHEFEPSNTSSTPLPTQETRFLAFKALPPASTIQSSKGDDDAHTPLNEIETCKHITEEIARVANKFTECTRGLKIEEKDIISEAEAKKATGWVESLGYNLKKLIWT